MTKRILAKDIFLPSPLAQECDIGGALSPIMEMLEGSRTSNRNELLVIGIEALIESGANTGPKIVRAAVSLGFKREHAGAVLGANEGSSPDRHRWHRDPAHATTFNNKSRT